MSAADLRRALTTPRFRTDEMPEGETCSLLEFLDANCDTPDVMAWARNAQPGDEYRDIVTATRVS